MGGKKSEKKIIDYTRSGFYWNIFGREFKSRRLHQNCWRFWHWHRWFNERI